MPKGPWRLLLIDNGGGDENNVAPKLGFDYGIYYTVRRISAQCWDLFFRLLLDFIRYVT